MKTIIAGSRGIKFPKLIEVCIEESNIPITEVVCGMAPGVDMLGYEWALKHGVRIRKFPADWTKHGRAAGPIRNISMAEYADALIAVWDGKSKGTKQMIGSMDAAEKNVRLFRDEVHFLLPTNPIYPNYKEPYGLNERAGIEVYCG